MHRHSLNSKQQLKNIVDRLIGVSRASNSYEWEHRSSKQNEDKFRPQHHDSAFLKTETTSMFTSELSVMASLKQVKGNSGTLLSITHYSKNDHRHVR